MILFIAQIPVFVAYFPIKQHFVPCGRGRDARQSMNGVPLMAKSHHTSYYATFALEGDQRLELQISEGQFQRLTEGERGKLTYQRKRFHRFEGVDA